MNPTEGRVGWQRNELNKMPHTYPPFSLRTNPRHQMDAINFSQAVVGLILQESSSESQALT